MAGWGSYFSFRSLWGAAHDESTLELPALGRPMQLGMLYDCRSDKLIPGVTLWDQSVLKSHRDIRYQPQTHFEIISTDSIDNKTTALSVDGSLKASILGGLLEVGGSAKYIHDTKRSKHQSRVTLQYKSTVRFEQLTMEHLATERVAYKEVFDKGTGTHVVTGILYGAQAFFVFDRFIEKTDDEKNVHGELKGLIKKIPAIDIGGEGNLTFKGMDKSELNKIQCTFYGDFALDKNPSNYEDAIGIYAELPSKLGKKGEHAVPLTVWLHPLSKLDSNAARLVREISTNVVDKAQMVLEGLDECKVTCDDLANREICKYFPQFKQKIISFQNLIAEYKGSFQQKLASALPLIRGGGAEEKMLLKVISDSMASPFSTHELTSWVINRQNEMKIVESYIKNIGNYTILQSKESLPAFVLSHSNKTLVCFSFTSVDHEDTYLKTMSSYISTETPGSYHVPREWFDNNLVIDKMLLTATGFKDFAAANHLTENLSFAIICFNVAVGEAQEGASIVIYKRGALVSKQFEPPGAPGKPTIVEKAHNAVTLDWTHPKFGHSNVVTYRVKYKMSPNGEWNNFETDDNDNYAVVTDLEPNTVYVFSVVPVSDVGVGQESVSSDVCKTLATAPPNGIRPLEVWDKCMRIAWDPPTSTGKGISVKRYKVRYECIENASPGNVLIKETKGSSCMYTISNLELNTTYSICVCAVCDEYGDSAYSEAINISSAIDLGAIGPPGLLKIVDQTHNSVSLEWLKPNKSSKVLHYFVKYTDKPIEKGEWIGIQTSDNALSATICQLTPNTTYSFSVAAVGESGVSGSSICPRTCKTHASCPPLNLMGKNISCTFLTLQWDQPIGRAKGLFVRCYTVRYQPADDNELFRDDYLEQTSEDSKCLLKIDRLKPNTKYRIWVSAVYNEDCESPLSQPLELATHHGISAELNALSTEVRKGDPSNGKLSIYKLRLEKKLDKKSVKDKYQTYFVGKTSKICKKHIVIMVVGATGAGKSTLINGIINYIFKVEWRDDFRFKIIDEQGENQTGRQADSQTQIITSYTINPPLGSNIGCTVTIIDTPGFGDTRGIQQDKIIVEQIRDFFMDAKLHYVDHIDVIGFVAQASQARLTHTQRYVFESILSVFGKDIGQNIMMLLTFADGKNPPVKEAIKAAKIPCTDANTFKFNNSALFSDRSTDEDSDFDEMFWKMGERSMSSFFKAVNKVESKSLLLTQEVLKERRQLEVALEGIQPKIEHGLVKLEEIRKEQQILEQYQTEIEANKDFEYEVKVPQSRKIEVSSGEYLTNCANCHYTCHYPCKLADDKDKIGCAAMDDTNHCTVCEKKCIWSDHYNQKYRFEYYTVTEKKTYAELEKKHKEASGKKLSREQILQKLSDELTRAKDKVFNLITESHRRLKRLDDIALRPNPLGTVEYVDLMIETEKTEARAGWKDRITSLQNVRKQAELVSKIKKMPKNVGGFKGFFQQLTH